MPDPTLRRERLLLGLLIVVTSVSTLLWLELDTRPQSFRDNYFSGTLRFLHGLGDARLSDLPRLIEQAGLQVRPPLYSILAVPFVYLFGPSLDAMLIVNVVMHAVLLLSVFAAGKLLEDGRVGLLAAFFVATYGPIAQIARLFRPHAVVPTFVALSLCLSLWFARTRSVQSAWLLGLSIGVGCLFHPVLIYLLPITTLLFCAHAVLFGTQPHRPTQPSQTPQWLLSKLRQRSVVIGLLPGALLALGLAGLWYLPRVDQIVGRLDSFDERWAGITVGFGDVEPSFWWHIQTMPGTISWAFTGLLVAGLVSALLTRRALTFLLAVSLPLTYCVLHLEPGGLAWKEATGLLPLAALLTALFLIRLRDWTAGSRGALPSNLLLGSAVGVALLVYWTVTWGAPPYTAPMLDALGARAERPMALSLTSNPPGAGIPTLDGVLQAIVDDRRSDRGAAQITWVAERGDAIDPSAIRFSAAANHPELALEVRSTARPLAWLTADYIFYSAPTRGTTLLFAVAGFIGENPEVFAHTHEEIGRFDLLDGATATLLKRTRPLTLREAEASIAMLSFPEHLKGQMTTRARKLLSR